MKMGKRLMVVAHPDDEVIFGGAHLIRYKHWKVVCVTNGNNRIRKREFERVMRAVGADYEIWNYRDTYSRNFDIVRLKKDLSRLILQSQFQMIVTHGLKGEYGHPQHIVIAQVMRNLVQHNLYTFAVGKMRLSELTLHRKKNLLRMYWSQKQTIWELRRDNLLDNFINREHFNLVKK